MCRTYSDVNARANGPCDLSEYVLYRVCLQIYLFMQSPQVSMRQFVNYMYMDTGRVLLVQSVLRKD